MFTRRLSSQAEGNEECHLGKPAKDTSSLAYTLQGLMILRSLPIGSLLRWSQAFLLIFFTGLAKYLITKTIEKKLTNEQRPLCRNSLVPKFLGYFVRNGQISAKILILLIGGKDYGKIIFHQREFCKKKRDIEQNEHYMRSEKQKRSICELNSSESTFDTFTANITVILNVSGFKYTGIDSCVVCVPNTGMNLGFVEKPTFAMLIEKSVNFIHANLKVTNLTGVNLSGIELGRFPSVS